MSGCQRTVIRAMGQFPRAGWGSRLRQRLKVGQDCGSAGLRPAPTALMLKVWEGSPWELVPEAARETNHRPQVTALRQAWGLLG